jgi:integrase
MKHSSKKPASKKPYPDFPLYAHSRGYWAKKVRGKLHYFGKVADDPAGQKALALWKEQQDDLRAGRVPRTNGDGFTVAELCNRFLTAKQNQLDVGEITLRTWNDYKSVCEIVVKKFGLHRLVADLIGDDFEGLKKSVSKNLNPVSIGNIIVRTKTIFKFGYDHGLMDKPVRYGAMFKQPSRKLLRMNRAKQAPKLFSVVEIKAILQEAPLQLKAMILLAINCGFGNADCATLPMRAVHLKSGWIDYPRPKTGIARRCPLWPETIQALEAVIAKRKEPKDDVNKGLLFITKYGGSWFKETPDNPISNEMGKVLKTLDLQQKGRSFYSLRHTFRTVADESRDQPACDHIMGHTSEHISSHYRERIDDKRLIAVSDYVRGWLFGKEGKGDE